MIERKYTDEEIVNALECFSVGVGCKGCPFIDQGCFDCGNIPTEFSESILALIKRQKADIEKLQEVNADLNESLRLAAEANKDLNAEVERLKSSEDGLKVIELYDTIETLTNELDAMRCAANSLKMHYEKAKAEVEEWKARAKERQGRVKKYLAKIERMEQESNFLAKRFYKEGVKDLAERLKANMCHGYLYLEIEEDLFRRDVDNLVAEMTEGE